MTIPAVFCCIGIRLAQNLKAVNHALPVSDANSKNDPVQLVKADLLPCSPANWPLFAGGGICGGPASILGQLPRLLRADALQEVGRQVGAGAAVGWLALEVRRTAASRNRRARLADRRDGAGARVVVARPSAIQLCHQGSESASCAVFERGDDIMHIMEQS